MEIIYKEQKCFSEAQLEQLFLSVGWASGRYPRRLAEGLRNSSRVISAWDGGELVGIVRSLDDGATAAFIHYLLVKPGYQKLCIGGTLLSRLLEAYREYLYVKIMPSAPKTIPFYEKFGFRTYDNYSAMVITRLGSVPDTLPAQ